jgi:3D (Asp-Asp-Asp) domain-containing protein
MKFAIPFLLALLTIGCASPKKPVAKAGQRMTVRTTAYTHTEAGGSHNAIDSRLHFGGDVYSAASDWSWLPLGTRFRMVENGRQYVIEDYGSALVGRQTIDLYVPSRGEVRHWGVRQVDIEVLEWGSKAMSLKLLKPRATRGYIRAMVAALEKSVPTTTPKITSSSATSLASASF